MPPKVNPVVSIIEQWRAQMETVSNTCTETLDKDLSKTFRKAYADVVAVRGSLQDMTTNSTVPTTSIQPVLTKLSDATATTIDFVCLITRRNRTCQKWPLTNKSEAPG